jgi:hypothetical protein
MLIEALREQEHTETPMRLDLTWARAILFPMAEDARYPGTARAERRLIRYNRWVIR